jgi:hypothetical protein
MYVSVCNVYVCNVCMYASILYMYIYVCEMYACIYVMYVCMYVFMHVCEGWTKIALRPLSSITEVKVESLLQLQQSTCF